MQAPVDKIDRCHEVADAKGESDEGYAERVAAWNGAKEGFVEKHSRVLLHIARHREWNRPFTVGEWAQKRRGRILPVPEETEPEQSRSSGGPSTSGNAVGSAAGLQCTTLMLCNTHVG